MASSEAPMESVRQGADMQMHQIRYFLALCEERSFTLAARRSGVSQPSLTNAISALERELGGALFQRRPVIALTALGQAMQPYLTQIAQAADQARETAQALADVEPPMSDVPTLDQRARSPECSSG
jgi:DNA-binding transcriptional LysR family regulator